MSSDLEKETEEKKLLEKDASEKLPPPVEKPKPKRRPAANKSQTTSFYRKISAEMLSPPNKYIVAAGATAVAAYVGYMAYMQTTTEIPAIKSDQSRTLQRK